MKKILLTVLAILLVVGAGVGVYYLFFRQTNTDLLVCNQACSENNQCESNFCYQGFCRLENCPESDSCSCQISGDGLKIVKQDFLENFYDGQIDDFWIWDDGDNGNNSYEVDNVREELVIKSVGGTSQWTNDNSAPRLYFDTDQNFTMEVEYEFDPRVDFQHAGIGIRDKKTGDWIRISRSYDTHSLEDPYDQPNSLYVMEKKSDEGVLKYNHVNFSDAKVYVRMKRVGGVVSFEYSRDGNSWYFLGEVRRDDFAQIVEVYLFDYSTNPNSDIAVTFRKIDFAVSKD